MRNPHDKSGFSIRMPLTIVLIHYLVACIIIVHFFRQVLNVEDLLPCMTSLWMFKSGFDSVLRSVSFLMLNNGASSGAYVVFCASRNSFCGTIRQYSQLWTRSSSVLLSKFKKTFTGPLLNHMTLLCILGKIDVPFSNRSRLTYK